MINVRVCIYIFLILTLLSPAGEAFVPKTPHLLYLVVEKIRKPAGIQAFQNKKIVNYQDQGPGYVEIVERLLYAFPGKFRTDVTSGTVSGFSIETDGQFVKVINDVIVSTQKPMLDAWSDILLYRDYETLAHQLSLSGVDTEKVTFKRYRDTICYVIGGSPSKDEMDSSLWIEKDSFLPLRYVVVKDGWVVEFLYGHWQKFSKTWYPMQISIFFDNQLYALVDVKSVELKKVNPSSMFDVAMVKASYPDGRDTENDQDGLDQVDELEKSIKDFGKLFD